MVQYHLISINVYQECYLLVRMSMQINLLHVFKMSASRTHACFESHMPLISGCVFISYWKPWLPVTNKISVSQWHHN